MNAAIMVGRYYAQNYLAEASNKASRKSEGADASFRAKAESTEQKAARKEYPSAVEDWKRRHPESAWQVDNQVRAGKAVLRKNGVENVDRESMTMEEYKQFFTHLMNSIPYDVSQQRDVNVWSITKEGWEQMMNDPDYEAWVLGYTSTDRAFHNPWAAWPGCAPRYHTEKFGASIDEHLGQSFAMKSPTEDDDEESWWEKRHKRFKKLMKEQEEKAAKEAVLKSKMQREIWQKESAAQSMRLHQFLSQHSSESQTGKEFGSDAGQVMQAYESLIISLGAQDLFGGGAAPN